MIKPNEEMKELMGERDTETLKRAITTETLISLGQVALLIMGVWWISERLHAIDVRLLSIETRIERRWTIDDMKIWGQEFQIKNPTIAVPTVQPSLFQK